MVRIGGEPTVVGACRLLSRESRRRISASTARRIRRRFARRAPSRGAAARARPRLHRAPIATSARSNCCGAASGPMRAITASTRCSAARVSRRRADRARRGAEFLRAASGGDPMWDATRSAAPPTDGPRRRSIRARRSRAAAADQGLLASRGEVRAGGGGLTRISARPTCSPRCRSQTSMRAISNISPPGAAPAARRLRAPAGRAAFPSLRPNPHIAVRAVAAGAPVAQLDRALPSEGRGHRFESCRARHKINGLGRRSLRARIA